ncbi:MAG: hypothetical protein J6R47_04185 [Acholeplasmatales bacterium]|nr:hypothetical protein [Acholeplasmatales bacterium]
MHKNPKSKPIIITFRTPNGNQWDETHSIQTFDLFKKDPAVFVIVDKETDEIIYRREVDN